MCAALSLSQQDASFVNMSQTFQQMNMNCTKPSTVSPPSSYHTKKLGDIMNEIDGLLAHKRYDLRQDMTTQLKQVLTELQARYEDLEDMINEKTIPDSTAILAQQILLNDIENHATQGIYGVQGQIKPLTEKEQQHHIIMTVIPPGQATVRDLLERCHQLITRLLDRVEASKQQYNENSYDNKKLSDLFDELDQTFSYPSKSSKKQVHQLFVQLLKLYQELKHMTQFKPDLSLLTEKQQLLHELENQAVCGVYGIQAQIVPLHHMGDHPHHVRMEAIPEGQATVRGLIERCHQLCTRLMDRIEEFDRVKAKSCACSH